MGTKPKIQKAPAPAAPVANDPTAAVTTLVKKARTADTRRPVAAATGSYGTGKTLLGSGIR